MDKLIGKLIVEIHIVDWLWAQRLPAELTMKTLETDLRFFPTEKKMEKGSRYFGS